MIPVVATGRPAPRRGRPSRAGKEWAARGTVASSNAVVGYGGGGLVARNL